MSFRLGLAVAGAGLMATPHVALAQGASWAAQLPPKIPNDMVLTLNRYRYFMDCVAASEWDVAKPLFDARIGSAEERKILKEITGGTKGSHCTYAYQMRMSSMLMRGGIAEARYRLKTRNNPVPATGPDETAPVPAGASFQWVGFFKESAAPRLWAFANCLAERHPDAVHAVLATGLGSRDERVAMQSLSRRFGACLQPGEQVNANLLTFRPWLGEVQYQLYRKSKGDA